MPMSLLRMIRFDHSMVVLDKQSTPKRPVDPGVLDCEPECVAVHALLV
jgi:hypothetical protein